MLQCSCIVRANHTSDGRDREIDTLLHLLLKPLKDKYRLMKTGRLTVVGEALICDTYAAEHRWKRKPVSCVLPYGVKRSESD